jgi:hypothetical protein
MIVDSYDLTLTSIKRASWPSLVTISSSGMSRLRVRVMLGLECSPDINDGWSAQLLRVRVSLGAPLEIEPWAGRDPTSPR